jgi:hypothetical protein
MDLKEIEEIRKGIEAELEDLYELSTMVYSLKNVIEYFDKNGVKVSIIGV